MKQRKTIYYLLAALLLLVSCKSSDDIWTASLYNDASINGFTLGTLNRYVNGVKKTYAGSNYIMQINPATRTIENTDSLPIYTDAGHVICSISTLNNGYLNIKSLTDETFTLYNAADSIDFNTSRTFRVFASDGSGYNDYTVKVNVHQEDGDAFVWKAMTPSTPITPAVPEGWSYLGKSTFEEYSLSSDNKLMVRIKDETTWEQDLTDAQEDIEHFPTYSISLVSYPMSMADSTDYVLLAGINNGKTAVWRKIVEYTHKLPMGVWTYMDRGSETSGLLPPLTSLSLIRYDGMVFAFGGDFKTIYESRDNGITWKKTTRITMPTDFDYNNTNAMEVTTDSDNYIWLRCTMSDASTKVWRGRLNKLGWKK